MKTGLSLSQLPVIAMFALLPLTGWSQVLLAGEEGSVARAPGLDNFETIYYARGQFVGDGLRSDAQDVLHMLRIPFLNLLDELRALDPSFASNVFHEASFVVLGARNFRAPKRTGLFAYDFCYVVVLKKGALVELATAFNHPPTLTKGVPVWIRSRASGDVESKADAVYFAQMGRLLIVSNSADDLDAVAKGVTGALGGTKDQVALKALPTPVVWGSRRFPNQTVEADEAHGSRKAPVPPKAIEFLADTDTKKCVLRIDSPERSGFVESLMGVLRPNWSKTGTTQGAPDTGKAWEARFSLAGDITALSGSLLVLSLLGFGVLP